MSPEKLFNLRGTEHLASLRGVEIAHSMALHFKKANII